MKPFVTDHALVRYLERVRGFDLSKERQAIAALCDGITNGTVKRDGCKYEIVAGRVVTIAPDCGYPSKTAKQRLMERLA